jgi:hypothetical protein
LARQHLGQRRSVLALQTLEQGEPVLHLLQPRGRRVDSRGVRSQEVREVLELRLDAIARLDMRREARVERAQILEPLPDDAEIPRTARSPS